jgi:hypothetical protein
MKLVDSILYLEFNDAIESQVASSENYLWKELSRKAKWLRSIKDPSDNRKVLIEFESLPEEKKQKVIIRFGDPYQAIAKQPIKELITKDLKAEQYFLQYRYTKGDQDAKLPIETVNEYTRAASWLNMLVIIRSDRKQVKKQLNISIGEFWKHAIELIDKEKIQLPTNPRRLFEKIDAYEQAQGDDKYNTIIHKNFGNNHSLKVNSELSKALLLQLIAQPHHDDIQKTRVYNEWAVKNEHEQITPRTLCNWRMENEWLISANKNGSAAWYNKFGKQLQRNRPTAPLFLVGSDDNELDLYFQGNKLNKKNYSVINYYNRFKAIIVMDAYNDYILGYAIAEEITVDLVKLAYLDAIYHIKDLTGDFYLPLQIQSDRWNFTALKEFYESIAVYTPARAKAPRGKYIERAFGDKWETLLKYYVNYAGPNITAATKANDEFIDAHKKDFPTKEQAHHQIADFINKLRNLVDENTGKSKQDQWLDAFTASELSKKKQIGEMQLLLTFGRVHDYKNTITNKGITPAINCIEHNYEIPDEYYLQTVGKRVQVIYEPFDYSRILVTDGGNLRFIAREYQKLPSAIADYQPGDRKRINDRLEEKKMHVQMIATQNAKHQKTLQKSGINAEGLLRMGNMLPKEIKQQAELEYREQRNSATDTTDPFDLM